MLKCNIKSHIASDGGMRFFGSNNIVVFLTIQYYCLSLRHE